MAKQERKLTLAIEATIAGGSLALLDGDELVAFSACKAGDKTSESILAKIDELFADNSIGSMDIVHVAVSAGPGSFTGIRIGCATAMGLADAIGCRYSSHSLLDAFAAARGPVFDRLVVVIGIGRGNVALQEFSRRADRIAPTSDPRVASIESLASENPSGCTLVCDEVVFPLIAVHYDDLQVIEEPATALGRFALTEPNSIREPIFLSRANV